MVRQREEKKIRTIRKRKLGCNKERRTKEWQFEVQESNRFGVIVENHSYITLW